MQKGVMIPFCFRKDHGDINGLAESIKEIGQLQPVGIDANYNMIFGERRIMACNALGMDTIEGNIIHLENTLKGEFAENEFSKGWTVSERIAIGKAIEEELGNRQGQRTDLGLVENFPQVKGIKTRDIAAEQSGFGQGLLKIKQEVGHGSSAANKDVENGGWKGLFSGKNGLFEGGENVRFQFGERQARRFMGLAKQPKLTRHLVKQNESYKYRNALR